MYLDINYIYLHRRNVSRKNKMISNLKLMKYFCIFMITNA
jgi:hypothetical protein